WLRDSMPSSSALIRRLRRIGRARRRSAGRRLLDGAGLRLLDGAGHLLLDGAGPRLFDGPELRLLDGSERHASLAAMTQPLVLPPLGPGGLAPGAVLRIQRVLSQDGVLAGLIPLG